MTENRPSFLIKERRPGSLLILLFNLAIEEAKPRLALVQRIGGVRRGVQLHALDADGLQLLAGLDDAYRACISLDLVSQVAVLPAAVFIIVSESNDGKGMLAGRGQDPVCPADALAAGGQVLAQEGC